MSISEAIALMLEEEGHVPTALLKEREKLGWVVERISESFRKGGRLFYVGAGTSGRLGVLDASECPPTFRSPPEQVQGIIAGGYEALWRPSEGAEDDPSAGAAAIGFRGITASDIIIGIAASGRTPFVWGALWEAKQRGATTILLCFNPSLEVDPSDQPDSIIAPDLGPEVLTGSTRLKCGTATKLVLNLFTTLSMVRSGKALSNWMVDLNPASEKLKARAVRIVSDLTGLAEPEARELLEAHGWSIRAAYDAGRG